MKICFNICLLIAIAFICLIIGSDVVIGAKYSYKMKKYSYGTTEAPTTAAPTTAAPTTKKYYYVKKTTTAAPTTTTRKYYQPMSSYR